MKPLTLSVSTRRRTEWVDLTRDVARALAEAGHPEGFVTVYVPHTTAGVTINEHADPDVARDLERRLDELIPWDDPRDRHGEGNTAAHLKTSFVGNSVRVPVSGGRLALGTWQGIFLCEFDGPRTRNVWIYPEKTA